jgi:large subunit ribosomal protein L29
VTKTSELRGLTDEEIETRLVETKEELFNLRFQNATGQLDNYRRLAQLRRDVARINTIIRERQLAGQ